MHFLSIHDATFLKYQHLYNEYKKLYTYNKRDFPTLTQRVQCTTRLQKQNYKRF